MPFDKTGTLIINATSAGGALPAENTVVRIFGAGEENRDVEYSIVTDVDGISRSIILPAPSRLLSQTPGSREQSYAVYNIEITSPGFYSKKIYNVAVFEDEKTIQPINMIPLPENRIGVTYPRDTLTTYVQENEMLE